MDSLIHIRDYDPRWAAEFSGLRAVLAELLQGLATRIEHIGSTAVPGLVAKPILDVDAVIRGGSDLPPTIRKLESVGYRHQGDLDIAGREAFARSASTVPNTESGRVWMDHHLYVCKEGASELARHLAFRDCLRREPEAVREYGILKRDLADRFRADRQRYTDQKTQFIESILSRVLDE